ncbi:undecaprenyl-phosphate glucose phosphotransferase [Cognatazoarcus halotolerans]|uniref:undecaprenyl-phosphate glucose phosphotransferase n=1 Tax=Cognatazoarcus halotolerans TaxID=2686016 RepID=UPI001358BDDF|nr:undecaprenyl-phosphate glucose phosphotransferase [Cognatazoarcus halotolerans]MBX3680379.1 undecaprenyl-phosphate glucose phosphotransferase [Rhodocyclaceae bacterium]MCB1898622.1 undecaprenyl-phosphate glucose phosphotransferase [Rhodocyclaceae bacterium]MCP5310851.1 undecaprenyl-phosphate glucose phosphotransferase [Zoogloeaceae bacterium]
MFAALDKHPGFFRTSFTLTGFVESFLDPLVVIGVLFACALAFGERVAAPYVILGLLSFSLTFPGNIHFHEPLRRMVRKTITNWLLFVVILGGFGYASGYLSFFPEPVLMLWASMTPLALIGGQLLARMVLPRVIAIGNNQRLAVVAGLNDMGLGVAQQFVANPYLSTRFLGFFDDRSRDRLPDPGNLPMLGGLGQLAEYVKQHHVEAIYLALPMATQPRILRLLDDLKDTTASIYFVPDIFVTDLIQGRMDNVGGMPVVAVCETPFTGLNGVAKRLSDVLLSILILILISPVMLAVAAGVKLSSPGPVIFKQRRYGLDGKEIVVYKFRSMTTCDDGAVVRQASRNDKRITPFGAFIRRTSLDELPQFFNVLQGRMSIVGPRPHAVAHNETYRKLVKGYMVRHKVKPGITGWAQVNGYRGETETIDKMEKRIEYDLEYLRNWSLAMDLWIVIKTALLVIKDRQAY